MQATIPSIKVKTKANQLHLRPSGMWPNSPIFVYALLPAPNGYAEDYIVELAVALNGKWTSITLPLTADQAGFACAGIRLRTTAMPENFGQVRITVCREQDPPQGPDNQRPAAATLALERFSPGADINLESQLMLTVDP